MGVPTRTAPTPTPDRRCKRTDGSNDIYRRQEWWQLKGTPRQTMEGRFWQLSYGRSQDVILTRTAAKTTTCMHQETPCRTNGGCGSVCRQQCSSLWADAKLQF